MATERDIQTWLDTANRSLDILTRRLGNLDSPKPDEQGLNMLHLAFAGLGYAHGAAGRFSDARNAFSDAVRTHIRLHDLFNISPDAQGYDRSGRFQTLLMAHAIGDTDLVASFGSRFSLSDEAKLASPADSTYIASVLIALNRNDTDSTIAILANGPPEIDAQFAGYIDCFSAIARNDQPMFEASLKSTAQHWREFVNRTFDGHPQSAFFLDGVGFAHLARQHGLHANTNSADIPLGLLDG